MRYLCFGLFVDVLGDELFHLFGGTDDEQQEQQGGEYARSDEHGHIDRERSAEVEIRVAKVRIDPRERRHKAGEQNGAYRGQLVARLPLTLAPSVAHDICLGRHDTAHYQGRKDHDRRHAKGNEPCGEVEFGGDIFREHARRDRLTYAERNALAARSGEGEGVGERKAESGDERRVHEHIAEKTLTDKFVGICRVAHHAHDAHARERRTEERITEDS